MRRTLALVMVLTLLMFGNNAAAVMNPPYPTEPTSALWKLYDPELHYWYQQLTETEKRLFSARYDCIALGQAEAVRRVQEAHDAGRHGIGFRMLDNAAFEEAARMVDSEDMSVFAGLGFPVTVDYTWNAHALYISWE